MRNWLGVIGRACIEFLLILFLLAASSGAMLSLDTGLYNFVAYMAIAAFDLIPLAAALTLFLAFFSFEQRIRSRLAGWLGLLILGSLLMAVGIQLRRIDVIKQSIPVPTTVSQTPRPSPAGISVTKSGVVLWYKEIRGGDLIDAVAVDFSSDYPRMAYSARSFFDPATGTAEIAGRSYTATRPAPAPIRLVPEASVFAGAWIWDRLAAMDREPILHVFAAAGGFILLVLGFRFLCRMTGWPLVNAVLAAAGFVGIIVLDAVLSGSAVQKVIIGIARELGIALPPIILLAALEGSVGLLLGFMDIAVAPRRRGDENE
jgi:hypothetical protein